MLFEIQELGFDSVELSFNLTRAQVRSVAQFIRRHRVRVVSLHNYCPIPDRIPRSLALPDCLSLSAPDEEERAKAVAFTQRTIDTAYELHARCVVLHCGRVAVSDRTRELCALYEKGCAATEEFRQIKEQVAQERSAAAPAFLNAVLRSLEELEGYARRKNICLGIETRFYHREIPSFDELRIILDTFKGAGVYYWHDTGHAQVMENLGFYRHKDFLDAYRNELIGVHLHDITGCHDHKAPSQGEFDFRLLKDYLTKSSYKVLEVHEPASPQDIRRAVAALEKVFDGII